MRLVLALGFTLLNACAVLNPEHPSDRTGSLSIKEREELYRQARQGAEQSRERYIATTRPALEQQFRQENPTMTEADLELLVNDALERGLRPEARRRPDGPIRQPSLDCMSAAWRNSPMTNCQ
ncbi:MAG: hypothetical protein QM706_20095 [Nitrospira sp.]